MSLSNRRTVWLSALEFRQGQALSLHKISPKIDLGNSSVDLQVRLSERVGVKPASTLFLFYIIKTMEG